MGVLLGFLPSLSQLFLFGKRSNRRWRRFSGRIAATNEMLASETITPRILQYEREQLNQSWRALEDALQEALPAFRLRDTTMIMEGHAARAQDLLESHRAFFTRRE